MYKMRIEGSSIVTDDLVPVWWKSSMYQWYQSAIVWLILKEGKNRGKHLKDQDKWIINNPFILEVLRRFLVEVLVVLIFFNPS